MVWGSSMGLIKTRDQIQRMRAVGRVTAAILNNLIVNTNEGDTGLDINARARKLFDEVGVEPAFLGLYGFPACLCISVNEYIVHGIPNSVPFKTGDVIKYDIGGILDGVCSDLARTFILGEALDPRHDALVEANRKCLDLAILEVRPGNTLRDIAAMIEKCAKVGGYGNVDEFNGHGIGEKLHEPPPVFNSLKYAKGIVIEEGMVLALEPMFTLGSGKTDVSKKNKWLIRTADGSVGSHFEDTVLCTRQGPEVLTR